MEPVELRLDVMLQEPTRSGHGTVEDTAGTEAEQHSGAASLRTVSGCRDRDAPLCQLSKEFTATARWFPASVFLSHTRDHAAADVTL